MVNARLSETARQAFFFASPRHFDCLDRETETSKSFKCEQETFTLLKFEPQIQSRARRMSLYSLLACFFELTGAENSIITHQPLPRVNKGYIYQQCKNGVPNDELLVRGGKRRGQASKESFFPLVLDYNPILPDVQKVIKKHFYILQSSPEVKEIFPSKSIFPAYRKTKNLKEMLAPSKFRAASSRNQREENGGCSKCNKKCDLCKNYFLSKLGNWSSISHSTKAVLFVRKCYLFSHLCQMQPAICRLHLH